MVRVVVYAEGAGEAGGQFTLLPSVGEPLRDEMLGAAHALIRRALAESWGLDASQIRFDSPLRHRGHFAKGSDLLREATLRQLLTWPRAEQQPAFAVVLVDADGDLQRRTRLRSIVQGLPGLRVLPLVAVAIQEFEAWLIADVQAVSGVLGGVDVSGASANPQGLHAVRPSVSWPSRLAREVKVRRAARCGARSRSVVHSTRLPAYAAASKSS